MKTLQKSSIGHSRLLVWVLWDVIVGSCNGLICLNRYHHGIRDPIHLCNPNTGEYVNLPEYTLSEGIRYAAAFGFGYVHSVTDDAQYKVVRIYYQFSSSGHCKGEVEVYTIGSGSGWRTIGRTSHKLFRQNSLGIFINGALHWIDLSVKKIVAFDLGDEEFRLIQSPPCYDSNQDCCFNLQVLRGNLSFCHQKNKDHILDIWSLTAKENTTEAPSWSKDFRIAYDSAWERDPLMPLLITKKNEILFVHQGSMLYCYDPETTTMIELWDVEKKGELVTITAFPT